MGRGDGDGKCCGGGASRGDGEIVFEGSWPHICHTSLQHGSQTGALRISLPPQPHYTENTSPPVLPVMSLPPLSCHLL